MQETHLIGLPLPGFLIQFKDAFFHKLFYYENATATFLQLLSQSIKKDPTLANALGTIFIILTVVWVLGSAISKSRRPLKLKPTEELATLKMELEKSRRELDSLRKYIIQSASAQPASASTADRQPRMAHTASNQTTEFRVMQSNLTYSCKLLYIANRFQQYVQKTQQLIGSYTTCLEDNNRFNNLFLDQFSQILMELKKLHKNRTASGLRSNSSAKTSQVSKELPPSQLEPNTHAKIPVATIDHTFASQTTHNENSSTSNGNDDNSPVVVNHIAAKSEPSPVVPAPMSVPVRLATEQKTLVVEPKIATVPQKKIAPKPPVRQVPPKPRAQASPAKVNIEVFDPEPQVTNPNIEIPRPPIVTLPVAITPPEVPVESLQTVKEDVITKSTAQQSITQPLELTVPVVNNIPKVVMKPPARPPPPVAGRGIRPPLRQPQVEVQVQDIAISPAPIITQRQPETIHTNTTAIQIKESPKVQKTTIVESTGLTTAQVSQLAEPEVPTIQVDLKPAPVRAKLPPPPPGAGGVRRPPPPPVRR